RSPVAPVTMMFFPENSMGVFLFEFEMDFFPENSMGVFLFEFEMDVAFRCGALPATRSGVAFRNAFRCSDSMGRQSLPANASSRKQTRDRHHRRTGADHS